MYGYVLQDWITVRGNIPSSGSVDIIQGESTWMGFSSFQDIVIWLDVREIAFPAGAPNQLTFNFDTAPSKDSNLFVTMASVGPLGSLTPGVQTLQKVILANNPTVPLATWLRWRLTPGGVSTNTWDATFRVLVAANRVVREGRQPMWR